MQNVLRSVSDILLHLYENAQHYHPDELQKETLNNLKLLIPYNYAVLGGGLASERRITDLTVIGQSPALMMEWMKIGHIDGFCDIAINQLGHARRFSDVPDYHNSLAYNEHWRSFDVADMIATISNEPQDNYVSFLGLCRSPDSTPYTKQELQIKYALTPHIVQALRINRQAYLHGIKTDDQGLALVDRAGLLKASRGVMTEIMREAWSQTRYIPEPTIKTLLKTGVWCGREFQLKASDIGPYLLITADVQKPTNVLTARELEAAKLFSKGLTHKQVAREMGNSPATVRNQISHVYDKLAIGSKAELAAFIMRKSEEHSGSGLYHAKYPHVRRVQHRE